MAKQRPTAEEVLAALSAGSAERIFVVNRRMTVVPIDGATGSWAAAAGANGNPCYEIVAGRDSPCPGCPVPEVVKTGQARTAEVQSDPAGRWKQVEGHPIVDNGGAPGHTVVVYRDITDRKLAEESLRVKNQAIASSINGIAIADVEGNLTYVNDSFLQMWGYDDQQEIVGQPAVAFWQTTSQASSVQDMVRSQGSWIGELVAKRKDGSTFDVHLSTSTVIDEDGKPVCVMASFVDISDRKQVEDALREGRRRVELILKYASDGINISEYDLKRHQRRLLLCNDRYVEMSGRSREELISADDIEEFFQIHASQEQRKEYWQSFMRGQPCKGTASWIRPDGKENYYEWAAAPLIRGDKLYIIGVDRDVTERRKTDEAIQASERRYRLLAENVTDMIWTTDMDQRFTYVSPSVERLLGYSVEEALTKSLKDVLTPSSYELAVKVLEEELAKEVEEPKDLQRSRTLEAEHVRKDGSMVWTEVRATFLRDDEDRPVGLVGVTRDISERKRAAKAIEQAEGRYRHVVESVPVVFWSRDTVNDRVLLVSSTCQRVWGYSPDDFYQNPALWREIVHPEDREGLRAKVREACLERGFWSGEFRVIHRDGSIRQMLESITCELDAAGKLIRTNGVSVDITDRRNTELTIRLLLKIARLSISATSESEFVEQSLAELQRELGIDAAIFYRYDSIANELVVGACRGISRKLARLLGPPRLETEAIGEWSRGPQQRRSIHNEHDRTNSMSASVRRELAELEGRPIVTVPLVAKESLLGALDVVSSQPAMLRQGQMQMLESIGNELAVGLVNWRAQAMMAASQRLRILGELAAGIAHDFNNILVAIVGGASFVKKRLPKRGNLHEAVERIEQASERAAGLVEQLLAFGQQRRVSPDLLDLNEVVRSAVELIQPGLGDNIELSVDLTDDLPAVWADRQQMEYVVIDLCLNARDAMPEGGKLWIATGQIYHDEQFAQRCVLYASRPGQHAVVMVRDNGVGMESDALDRIFEPFFTTKPGGHGLGLSVAHGTISAHHGALEVISEPGKGTVFSLYLPVSRGKPEANTTD